MPTYADEPALDTITFLSQSASLGGIYIQFYNSAGKYLADSAQTIANISNTTAQTLGPKGLNATIPAGAVFAKYKVLTADLYEGSGGNPDGSIVSGEVPMEPRRVGEVWTIGRYPR